VENAWSKYKDLPLPDCNLPSTEQSSRNNSTGRRETGTIERRIYGQRSTRVINELRAYLEEPAEDQDMDSLSYWRVKKGRWPRLAAMARDYLAVPATSASSERCFRTGRDLLAINRMSMVPETMEASMILRSLIRSGFISTSSLKID
jgi:hypothetical protein